MEVIEILVISYLVVVNIIGFAMMGIDKRKAIKKIAEKVAETLTDTSMPVYIMDADAPSDGELLASLIAEKRPDAKIVHQLVGPVIGAHCGPGTVGVVFVANERPIPLAK